ncbi:MAG: hypothetical protein B6242_01050 [Anaerolineaceae bacterium 4572_78]|nr:MAG: hypothetical protein B6242_01050 [Anaerolineaceae bacterium 4572_78]
MWSYSGAKKLAFFHVKASFDPPVYLVKKQRLTALALHLALSQRESGFQFTKSHEFLIRLNS